jgi:hypothetical protein
MSSKLKALAVEAVLRRHNSINEMHEDGEVDLEQIAKEVVALFDPEPQDNGDTARHWVEQLLENATQLKDEGVRVGAESFLARF